MQTVRIYEPGTHDSRNSIGIIVKEGPIYLTAICCTKVECSLIFEDTDRKRKKERATESVFLWLC